MIPIHVVGIGADGWSGLTDATRAAIADADVLIGSGRQLDLIPACSAERVRWPSPLLPALPGLFDDLADKRVCVLASGDPMFHGIGVTLARLLGIDRLRVLPQPSSASLACARLGWPLADTPVVSLVNRPAQTLLPDVVDGARLLVLSNDASTPTAVAKLLADNGFGGSTLHVLEQLGGPLERRFDGEAAAWPHAPGDPLNIVAVICRGDTRPRRTRIPGLVDAAFETDGQLTKQEVRALTLTALAPAPGELLWDVGGGTGSIGIEWCRTHPRCRAIIFERTAERADRIRRNALALGVPGVEIHGSAPAAFDDLPVPDVIFLGGGVTQPGLFDACWTRLRPGGRLVINAVTIETESQVIAWANEYGGTLRKLQVSRVEALGGFTAWRPQLPVTQWVADKPR
ncbi:precorrin-6y C5,15-methyltransferase (decarboxylating) subunit CbiE [Skermania sp. ID1734]|uniref:precorrin-6y C5,15-methyltransferase (decarboxylating) subunit CbiE n=1 Tax=Skermania sp. ID1734 TaxID=2597516 RepID=UPI00117D1295|nr:precorrin-6y C5,15-methyltransferase (decarboxylating) subunit CbiE [Skermania sp. ID1734]TSE01638.1 precorrin-6y C5,15-methyltransferase (decarboxylating) subunit CbiE [Skermania sp. ID1734]